MTELEIVRMEQAEIYLRQAVSDSMKSFFMYGEGKETINAVVKAGLSGFEASLPE